MKTKQQFQPRFLFAAVLGLMAVLAQLTAPSASAANRYWSANGITNSGNGTWDTITANRWGTAVAGPYTLAWVNGTDVAVLGSVSASTLTLGTNITCGGITAQANNSGSGNINQGAGPYTLTLGITGNNAFSGLQSTTAGRPLHINTVIVGAAGANVVLTGPSISGGQTAAMSLNRANTYSGGTTFAGHTLGAVNLTLGHQLALQNSSLTMNGIGSLIFSTNVLANAFTFGGLAATSSGARYNITLENSTPAAIALSVGNNNANTTYAGVMGGSGSLTKIGTGTLTLSGASTYSGTTTISNGTLKFVVGGSCANSTVILDVATATNSVSVTDSTKGWTNAAFTANAAGVLEFSFGVVTPSTTVAPLEITGASDFTATPQVRVVVTSGLVPGEYPLMTWGSTSGTAPTNSDLTVTTVAGGTAVGLSNSATTLYLVISGTTTTFVKADNAANLNLTNSWVGNVVPGLANLAKWDSTVTSPNTTVLGSDLTWAGIAIADPAGLVTIGASNTLTLGAANKDIDLSAATADLTLNCDLALGEANIWDVQSGRTLTVGGAVSGTNTITMQNAGMVILASVGNSYSGDTTVSASSTLKLGAANVLPHGSGKGNVAVDGTLDLNAFSEAINSLSGAGTVDTVAGGAPTLTLGANSPFTNNPFSGVIQNTAGSLSLTKTGTNLVVLSGANNPFSGAVKVNEGYLAVGAVSGVTDVLPNVSSITISNGTTLGAWASTTLTAPIIVAGGGTVGIAAPINPFSSPGTTARTFSLQGGISGNGNVVFKGVNQANGYGNVLVANCTYLGSTLITCSEELVGQLGFPTVVTNNNNIAVRLTGENALPPTTVVTMDGDFGVGSGRFCELNLNGFNQTLTGLTNVPGRTLRSQRVNNTSGTAATLTVSNSTAYTFSGLLGSAGVNLGLVKSGPGTFTISGNNTYTNGTTINGGTLLVNNTAGSGTGTNSVTVNSSGTLGGTGIIFGIVTNNAGGTLSPGTSGIGTLTLSSDVVLNAGSTNTFEVNGTTPANDVVVLGAAVAYGGALKIVPTGTFTNGQTFELFSGAGATDVSNFGSLVVNPPVSGTSFTFTNGVLTAAVVPVGPSGPATLTNSVSGSTLTFTWPSGESWRLVGQTNSRSIGVNQATNAWFTVPGGIDGSNSITINPANPTVFYRLVYP